MVGRLRPPRAARPAPTRARGAAVPPRPAQRLPALAKLPNQRLPLAARTTHHLRGPRQRACGGPATPRRQPPAHPHWSNGESAWVMALVDTVRAASVDTVVSSLVLHHVPISGNRSTVR